MDLFQTFTTQLAKINRAMRRIKKEEMKEYDLTDRHVNCLYYLYSHRNGMSFNELHELCGIDGATVSRTLARLKEKGFVVFENDEGKSYKYQIVLTEKGKDVAKRVYLKITHVLDVVRRNLSPDEERVFYKNLIQIAGNLDKFSRKYDE